MKVLINTIGKKIHTLVKKNTPSCHKIGQECGFTQNASLFSVLLCFHPHCQANIGIYICIGRLDLYLLTHTKKYMTPIHALIFEKHVKMCVSIRGLKSRCNFITLLGNYTQQKKVGWEVIFSELGLAGSGRVSPGGSSRAAPSSRFFMFSEA